MKTEVYAGRKKCAPPDTTHQSNNGIRAMAYLSSAQSQEPLGRRDLS